MKEEEQLPLFEILADWEKEWASMPEFIQNNLEPYQQIIVSFDSEEDVIAFSELIKQQLTCNTKSIWFPQVEIGKVSNKRYSNSDKNTSVNNE